MWVEAEIEWFVKPNAKDMKKFQDRLHFDGLWS